MINTFRGKYAFLSNFHPCIVSFEGIAYPSSEHAFIAQKILSPICRRVISQILEPGTAKRIGRNLPIRKDWNDVRVSLMLMILFAKFSDQTIANKLLLTDNEELVEGNWWHDNFWGNCQCEKCKNITGQNWLGKLLTVVRFYLKVQKEKN
jgi:hypothetical protein